MWLFLAENQYMVLKSVFIYLFTGYGKTVSHVVIGLKTAKGTKQLKASSA